MPLVDPASPLLLVVGREEFTTPPHFPEDAACAATQDCVAVAVRLDGTPTSLSVTPSSAASRLVELGRFEVETEGLLSVRDIYNREHAAVGVSPGWVTVTVWGDHAFEPGEVHVQFEQALQDDEP